MISLSSINKQDQKLKSMAIRPIKSRAHVCVCLYMYIYDFNNLLLKSYFVILIVGLHVLYFFNIYANWKLFIIQYP